MGSKSVHKLYAHKSEEKHEEDLPYSHAPGSTPESGSSLAQTELSLLKMSNCWCVLECRSLWDWIAGHKHLLHGSGHLRSLSKGLLRHSRNLGRYVS